MSTINGIGTKLLSFTLPDEQGISNATEWVVFLYLPVFPLSRLTIIMKDNTHKSQSYSILKKEPPIKSEVISTYLWGWVWSILMIFGPIILCAVLTETKVVATSSSLFTYLIVFSLIWLLVMIGLLNAWQQDRGLQERTTPLSKFMV